MPWCIVAKVLQEGNELPASEAALTKYLHQTVSIALAGADPEDLHNAEQFQIPRRDFIEASRFCTEHSFAYQDCVMNEARAAELFAEKGRSIDAVVKQAVPVVAQEELRQRSKHCCAATLNIPTLRCPEERRAFRLKRISA